MQSLKINSTLQGGKYKIIAMFGQGGFGITYLAENTMLDGKVAIKEFFFKDYCNRDEETSHVTIPTEGNREIVERFKTKFIKEARTIFKLNHPNIVRILDIFEENGTAYYVMDYIEGESLNDLVKRRGAIPEAEAIGYIREAGSALTYIHGKNLNHLDIKPGNLMKRKDNGKVQVIDFGVSKQYDSTTGNQTSTTPVGISHGYAPIEQYQKNGVQSFSPQSDVYALAATLYKLLTGITPPEAMIVQEDGLPVEDLRAKGVSGRVINAIDAAMQMRRKRTQSVAEFLRNLESKDEGEVTVMTTDIPKKEAPKRQQAAVSQPKRNKTALWAVVAVISIALVIVGVNQLSGGSSSEPQTEVTFLHCLKYLGPGGSSSEPQTEVTAPSEVKDKTIVLTHGHESKRNYVYSGAVDAGGVPNGQGRAQYPETKSSSSATFTGTFVNGMPGNGQLTFSSGVKFKGEFNKDGFYTKGTLWDQDGYYFKGTFNKGQPYNGTWYDPQGNEDSKIVNGK